MRRFGLLVVRRKINWLIDQCSDDTNQKWWCFDDWKTGHFQGAQRKLDQVLTLQNENVYFIDLFENQAWNGSEKSKSNGWLDQVH